MSPKRATPSKSPKKGDRKSDLKEKTLEKFALHLSGGGKRRESKGPDETSQTTNTISAKKLALGAGADSSIL